MNDVGLRKAVAAFSVVAVLVGISGCGGGGNGAPVTTGPETPPPTEPPPDTTNPGTPPTDPPPTEPPPIATEPETPPPTEPSPDAGYDREHLQGIFESAEFLDHTPVYSTGRTGSTREPTGTLVEATVTWTIPELKARIPETLELISDADFNGVTVGRTQSEISDGSSFLRFGGWLQHGYFETRIAGMVAGSASHVIDSASAYAVGGNPAGTNPVDGSVTWKGAVVGVDARPRSVWSMVGSATLTVDFMPYSSLPDIATVDIALGNLRREADADYTYDDIVFRNVPIFGGRFEDDLVTAADLREYPMRYRVRGAFFGSDHEEAVGTFVTTPTDDHRDHVIVGAFGAQREQTLAEDSP